jgi:positive regulator of sigma E activity
MDNGIVRKTEGNFAFIEMELNSGCSTCSNRGVCMSGDRPALIKIENTYGLNQGDKVEIDLPPQAKLTAGFLLFILPLIFLIIGYYIGYSIQPTETAGIAGGSIGFVIGIVDLIFLKKMFAKSSYFKPRSIRRI